MVVRKDCAICEDKTEVQKHHVSYYPECIILVCKSCHMKIHKTKGYYDDLEPNRERPDSFERNSPVGICGDCYFEASFVNREKLEEVTFEEMYLPSKECSFKNCENCVGAYKRLDQTIIDAIQTKL